MSKRTWKWLIVTAALALFVTGPGTAYAQALPGGSLDPTSIPKYVDPLIIPPEMPNNGTPNNYDISIRQFKQQILPSSGFTPGNKAFPTTTVWSYVVDGNPATFNYPAFTIEATKDVMTRVKWINGLVDKAGRFLPHLLPVDQTIHWANPPGGVANRDSDGKNGASYRGPVPMIPHLHGGHNFEWADGFPEAWFLPNAINIPPFFARVGSRFAEFKAKAAAAGAVWGDGFVVFNYPNDQAATTLWYHDHALGITRLNVYAGPAGFYLLRDDQDTGAADNPLGLPGPAPGHGGPPFFEIPIVVQDRSFNTDGSLFYPDHRKFFDGFAGPFLPAATSDVPPRWNPEFFANTMVVNGRTWPVLNVEPRRYRFRFLNGCNSRFLILKMVDNPLAARPATAALPFWQIGAEGGFLPAPVQLNQLLVGLAERADVIVDFTGLPEGTEIFLINEGPDEPFGGGEPNVDFPAADPDTTGQVMKFVVGPGPVDDPSTEPAALELPGPVLPPASTFTRRLSLNELASAIADGPIAALLGTMDGDNPVPKFWDDPITETPTFGTTETWEIFNFTEDAHPIHVHLVQFKVEGREVIGGGTSVAGQNTPLPWEAGLKDTVIAYPGEVTRIRATFDREGLFVWHCHILEHEDNEMMRPYQVVPAP